MRYVILTGMSGAGKSSALKMLEDMGYFCVDNLPIPLIEKFSELIEEENSRLQKVAVGIDIRNGQFMEELEYMLNNMKEQGRKFEILFLDADDSVLIKRYKETRRGHPLAIEERVEKGIEKERGLVEFLRQQADYIIDTGQLLTRELKAELEKIFVQNKDYQSLFVTILTFGFKYGIPVDSDLVFDVRFLPNPYYIEGLRPKTGNDPEIQEFVLKYKESHEFLDKLEDMVEFLIPNYIAEGKNQLIISIGCTGGKHRSVTLANELYKRLQKKDGFGIKIEHRDIGKDEIFCKFS